MTKIKDIFDLVIESYLAARYSNLEAIVRRGCGKDETNLFLNLCEYFAEIDAEITLGPYIAHSVLLR